MVLTIPRLQLSLSPVGHTYQQHALGCRVGLEVLKLYEEEQLLKNCQRQGLLLGALLASKLKHHENVGDIR